MIELVYGIALLLFQRNFSIFNIDSRATGYSADFCQVHGVPYIYGYGQDDCQWQSATTAVLRGCITKERQKMLNQGPER